MIYSISELPIEDSDLQSHGAVKIGSTSSWLTLRKRLIQLQQGNPRRLVIVAVVDGNQRLEKTLHAIFHEYRIRIYRGEWFYLRGEVEAFVRENALKSPIGIGDVWPDGNGGYVRSMSTRAQRQREQRALVAIAKRLGPNTRRRYSCTTCGVAGHNKRNCGQPAISLSVS